MAGLRWQDSPGPLPLAGVPDHEPPVPRPVRAAAGTAPLSAVWRNELGGLTWRVGDEAYVKWAPAGSGLDLSAEAERLRWAGRHGVRVPRVLGSGSDGDGAWLLTAALPGRSAVDAPGRSDPRRAAAAIGVLLRRVHDTLPVADCPFSWSVASRLARAGLDPAAFPAEPPPDRLVVCHADACAPNTILDDALRPVGIVDLGRLGVADRWADLAVATWSLEWNFGGGFDGVLLDAYGIAPDPERTAYYRRIWAAT